jgi:hypothetical protein
VTLALATHELLTDLEARRARVLRYPTTFVADVPRRDEDEEGQG